jgi:hypothetical protein
MVVGPVPESAPLRPSPAAAAALDAAVAAAELAKQDVLRAALNAVQPFAAEGDETALVFTKALGRLIPEQAVAAQGPNMLRMRATPRAKNQVPKYIMTISHLLALPFVELDGMESAIVTYLSESGGGGGFVCIV